MTIPDDQNDSDLLLAYGRDGNEAAFEILATRHVDMIFAVSLRRSRNRQLAEEATQNVLLALSQKARKLSLPEKNLTGWLHKSTRFEVAKLQRREIRMRKREQAYADNQMKTSPRSDNEAFQHLYPILDQAIDGLRPPDREVIVRRYLEGQNFSHIGEALGISEDAAQKRTSRAFERLNQYFKRKAGLTVSATALATGISQHCAEAAPATCLQIASNTAATGLTSILTTTTITTMSITKITTIATGLAIVGGTFAFLTNREDSPPTEVSPSNPPRAENLPPKPELGTQTVARNTERITQDPKPDSPNVEMVELEAMNPHPGMDEFARRLSLKHDQLLKDLTKDLALDASQTALVKQVLDVRLKAFRESLNTDPQTAPSLEESFQKEKEMLKTAGEIIRGVGLREGLTDILSEDQLTAFDEREKKNWQTQVESHTYRELSKLIPILDLTEEQKDRTFELLQTSSANKLNETANERAFMALQRGQDPTQMELTDLAEAEFLQSAFEGPNALVPGSPEFTKRITEIVGDQIEARVERLAPVLDNKQRQRYRHHLFQKSLLPQFGIELPSPESK